VLATSASNSADDNLKVEVFRLEGVVQAKEKEKKSLETTVKELREKIEVGREAQETLLKTQAENLHAVEKSFETSVDKLKAELEVRLAPLF